MQKEEDIRALLDWIVDEDAPEPERMPGRGYIRDRIQATEILTWVLEES